MCAGGGREAALRASGDVGASRLDCWAHEDDVEHLADDVADADVYGSTTTLASALAAFEATVSDDVDDDLEFGPAPRVPLRWIFEDEGPRAFAAAAARRRRVPVQFIACRARHTPRTSSRSCRTRARSARGTPARKPGGSDDDPHPPPLASPRGSRRASACSWTHGSGRSEDFNRRVKGPSPARVCSRLSACACQICVRSH
jgi:hypothetical protein